MKGDKNRMVPFGESISALIDTFNDYNNFLINQCDNIKDREEKSKKMEQGYKDAIKSFTDKLNSINVEEDEGNKIDELNSNIFGVNTINDGNVQKNANVDENKEQNDDEKKIKNMSIDELTNYIKNDKKKKKKKRNNKKKKKNNEQKKYNNIEIQEDKKEEIKTEKDEFDSVVEDFKKYITENTVYAKDVEEKIKPNISENWIKSLDDANKKNNNIEK